jgi:hypothetical protein
MMKDRNRVKSTLHHFLTMAQAARVLPQPRRTAAVWRWCRRGILTRAGERVYLWHVRFGRTMYTSMESLVKFGRLIAEADGRHLLPSPKLKTSAPGGEKAGPKKRSAARRHHARRP